MYDDFVKCLLLEGEKYMRNTIDGEYTDLYDEFKVKTGKKLFRKKGTKLEVPKGYYNIVVLAFIKNSEGKYLIQKTSSRKKGVYATTGGHVKAGEDSTFAIINEIKEELGIDIKKSECKLFKTYKYDTAFTDVYYIEKDIDLSKIKYEEDEVESAEYMSVDEIEKLISDNKFRKTNIDAFRDIINNK